MFSIFAKTVNEYQYQPALDIRSKMRVAQEERFDKNKLDNFTDIEQIKLASFVLNYDKFEASLYQYLSKRCLHLFLFDFFNKLLHIIWQICCEI